MARPTEQDPLGDGLGFMGAEVYGVNIPGGAEGPTSLDFAEETPDENQVDEELQSKITALIQDAQRHYDENIAPDQIDATNRYYGRLYGDELPNRSSVVSTDLRDTILDRHPDLLEIFTGSDTVVEFKPRGPEDVALAAQQTDIVNKVVMEDNDGFLMFNAVIKDSGTRRLGYTKWWWERSQRVQGKTYYAVSEQDLQAIAQHPDVEDYEILREYSLQVPQSQQDPATGEMVTQLGEVPVFDCEVRRIKKEGRVRVAAVPPEEIIWTPMARDFEDSAVVAHVRLMALEDVVAMGVKEDLAKQYVGQSTKDVPASDDLKWSRSFYGIGTKLPSALENGSDDPRAEVLFAEAYALCKPPNAEASELRMFQCLGPDYIIANGPYGELVDDVPIAPFTEDPEPHTIPGLCAWDHTKDIGRIKTQVKRAQLNSLAQAVEPQFVIGPSVNIEDVISPAITKFIRAKDVTQLREVKTTFVGPETLEVLAYYDQVKADRTGVAGPREGLDPNILQSTTAEAVESTLSKSQKRIKMIARVLAETGMKRMFRGILRLLVQHKNEWAKTAYEIRGEWVDIDPTNWDADRDLRVNVALGTGSKQQRINQLLQIAEKQEAHIQAGSPIVSFVELRATYGKLTELLGERDSTQFFKKWSQQDQQAMEQAQAQKPASDPAMALVEVEQMKAQATIALQEQKDQHAMQMKQLEVQTDARVAAAKLELDRQRMLLENDREKDKIARDAVLKERELELKHKADIKDAELRAQVQADRQAQAKQE